MPKFIIKSLTVCAMLVVTGVANAAVHVCSGSVAGMFQPPTKCEMSLNANSLYRADLLITPQAGSSGFNFWALALTDKATKTGLGGDALSWTGSSPMTLSQSFTTLSGGTTNAWFMGFSRNGLASYALTVTAIPEAPVWVMMLGGLGLVGLVLHRRKAGDAGMLAA